MASVGTYAASMGRPFGLLLSLVIGSKRCPRIDFRFALTISKRSIYRTRTSHSLCFDFDPTDCSLRIDNGAAVFLRR